MHVSVSMNFDFKLLLIIMEKKPECLNLKGKNQQQKLICQTLTMPQYKLKYYYYTEEEVFLLEKNFHQPFKNSTS